METILDSKELKAIPKTMHIVYIIYTVINAQMVGGCWVARTLFINTVHIIEDIRQKGIISE